MIELRTRFGILRILDASQAEDILSGESDERNQTFHFVNAFLLAEADKNLDYFQILSRGKCFCDSRPLELYSRIVYSRVKQLRGFDFLKKGLQSPSAGTQLIIGGSQMSEEEIIETVRVFFGRILDLSFHQPEFSRDISVLAASSLVAIERSRPRTIWLGVGTPKQDYLASRLRSEVDANLFCVGAAIAFLVGDVLESPKWIQLSGLEWLYRLGNEPRRLWRRYLIGNLLFLRVLGKDFMDRIASKKRF
jgi:N-acetylglucosaminyldiphosphoundecaprenol N-acetyl-beta-D-mannosaminyltransferase